MTLPPSPHRDRACSESGGSIVTEQASTRHGVARRRWIPPVLETHSTFTTVTQTALLFLQASVSQCFDAVTGQHVPCPPNS